MKQKKAGCSHAFLSLSQLELWFAASVQKQLNQYSWGVADL